MDKTRAQIMVENSSRELRDELTRLRALYATVKSLISAVANASASDEIEMPAFSVISDGTISGDLHAAICLIVWHHTDPHLWSGATITALSDLRRRYPAPVECGPSPCGDAGERDVPEVLLDSAAGEREAECGGVCGSADGEAASVVRCDGNHAGPPCGDPQCWNDSPPATPRSLDGADALRYGISAIAGKWERIEEVTLTPEQLSEMLEQVRSTTRRNILRLIAGETVDPTVVPEQDAVVAAAALRAIGDREQRQINDLQYAQNASKSWHREAIDAKELLTKREHELLGTIRGRDKTIDRLCRHIAFAVAK